MKNLEPDKTVRGQGFRGDFLKDFKDMLDERDSKIRECRRLRDLLTQTKADVTRLETSRSSLMKHLQSLAEFGGDEALVAEMSRVISDPDAARRFRAAMVSAFDGLVNEFGAVAP